ncbi:MAG: hypothetical protein R3E79_00605 [Caldilineaceae bacterium]
MGRVAGGESRVMRRWPTAGSHQRAAIFTSGTMTTDTDTHEKRCCRLVAAGQQLPAGSSAFPIRL